MIYSDNTYDITNNIATYTRRDFKSVFDTTSNKWYMLNNLNNYEEYGIYGNSFDTYYTGKLVIVNDREYEWNGTEWVDLGESFERVVAVYRDSSHKGNIKFPQYIRNISSFSATFKFIQSGGGIFLGSNGGSDSKDWRTFFHQGEIYYDCGSGRTQNNQIKINNTYNLLFSGNPMKLTNITTGAVIYTGSTTRPSSGDYNFCFGGVNEYGIDGGSTDYGYLYDLVLYSDNEGQNAIAHYIPKIQNDTVGMYDTINDVFVAAIGTLGAESGSVRPKDYDTKNDPTISTLFASTIYRNSAHLTTLMRNDAEMAKIDYMSDDILKKGEALPDFPYEVADFSKNGTSNTIPIYGLMIKVGYPVFGDYVHRDISFTTTKGATSSATDIVHINLIYLNGTYSDKRHSPSISDALISSLPTIEYNGENYYYYIFAVGNLYYNKSYIYSGSVGALEEENVKLITEIY